MSSDPQTPGKQKTTNWVPPAELVQSNIDALKKKHPELWQKLKEIELVDGALSNETGRVFVEFIQNNNPDLAEMKVFDVLHFMRTEIRRENGQIVYFSSGEG